MDNISAQFERHILDYLFQFRKLDPWIFSLKLIVDIHPSVSVSQNQTTGFGRHWKSFRRLPFISGLLPNYPTQILLYLTKKQRDVL